MAVRPRCALGLSAIQTVWGQYDYRHSFGRTRGFFCRGNKFDAGCLGRIQGLFRHSIVGSYSSTKYALGHYSAIVWPWYANIRRLNQRTLQDDGGVTEVT